jgi:predicted RNase H-like HicB family nuclease
MLFQSRLLTLLIFNKYDGFQVAQRLSLTPYTIEIIPAIDHGGYVARIRELDGCFTQADTWEELILMIQDVKTAWLESALDHGMTIPEPAGGFSTI